MKNFHSQQIPRKRKQFALATTLGFLLLSASLVGSLRAADDDVPFFAGTNGTPNIMFVFDNSDSMQDIAYLRQDGRTVRPGKDPNSGINTGSQDWVWRRGVQTETDANGNTTVREVNGVVQYDENAYPTETVMPVPEQTPLDLPGKTGLSSTADVTDPAAAQALTKATPANLPGKGSLESSISSIPDSGRIYDTSLTWGDALLTNNTQFNTNYLNRLVEVKDKFGDIQIRTITGRSTGSKYFTIDTALVAGGPLSYNAANEPYTYKILSEEPGRVTRGVSTTRVYDANIDWSTITSAWVGRLLTVTGGANTGETRTISSYNTTDKYWTVGSAFSAPCDQTSQYQITLVPPDASRIYDASLDWSTGGTVLTSDTLFNNNYRYRLVQVVGADGTIQERTILSRSVSGKYFSIDTAATAGGPLSYTAAGIPYTYTILTDGPGRVTRVRTDNLRHVTDADFDWSTLPTWSDFSSKWENRAIIITAGTNKDIKRRITNYSVSEKRWYVDTPFPVACDLTTRFQIIGTPDDNRLAFGGNHPASKLYQAKKALNLFLNDPSLKFCAEYDVNGDCTNLRYQVNMGFATYLSARVPRVTARYARLVPGSTVDPPPVTVPDRYCGTYRRSDDTSTTYYHPDSATTFVASGMDTAPSGATDWVSNRTHTGVSVGYRFDRIYRVGSCDQQVIRYTVTAIDPFPTDSLPNQKRFIVSSRVAQANEGGYWRTDRRCFDAPGVSSCAALPATSSGWTLIPSGNACYLACSFHAGYTYDDPPYTTASYYQNTYRDTWGDYTVTNVNAARYVNPITQMVNPYPGYSGSGWTVKNPPYATSDYQLMTSDLVDVVVNSSGATGTILANTFDTSYFMYPSDGTVDRPHGWSYQKTSQPYIYSKSENWTNALFPKVGSAPYSNPTYPWPHPNGVASWPASTWRESNQPTPYFPAQIGGEDANTSGEDQVVFVNLPPYDPTSPTFGDDLSGTNIAKILEHVETVRVQSPDRSSSWAERFDYTVMPYSKSIPPNAYSRLVGSGTPMAASLRNLKKYYEDYIAQDSLSQGLCRKNYIIFLTDGKETGDLKEDPDNPGNFIPDDDAPVNAARELYNLQIGEKRYQIKTFVIGLGLDAASKDKLNAIARAGSGDEKDAYFATDVQSLVKILVDEITTSILGESYTRVSPLISRYRSGEDLRLYVPRFQYAPWKGHLYAYDFDPGTLDLIGPAVGWNSDCGADGIRDADAGCEMKVYGRGTVYTSIFDSGNIVRRVFDPNNAFTVNELKSLVNPLGLDIDGDLTADTLLDAATVMHHTLNSGYDGNKYQGSRDPSWPLGDIYHSTPVIVTPPSFNAPPPPTLGDDPYEGYNEYKVDNAGRETLIYVGANDGMLHAFRSSNGREAWAYIPNGVLGKLHEFEEGHRFTVDSPIVAADIFHRGGGATIWGPVTSGNEKDGWHTLLVAGLRSGGQSYFALDVTDPANPQPAWEMTDADSDPTTRDMGRTWSVPNFARIKIDGETRDVIIVGGGISVSENKGNNLYILDAGSGDILKEIPVGSSTNNVPSEILLIREREKGEQYYGYTTLGYFGDTSGHLWKLKNLNDESGGAAWQPAIELLYAGQGKVFYKPAVSTVRGGCLVEIDGDEYTINSPTNFIVYGTGDEENPIDPESYDHFYEIADPPLTPTNIALPSLSKVWQIDFPKAEKMLSEPVLHFGAAIFSTYTPEGGCDQGQGYIWGLTLTKCKYAGGEAGLVYDLDGSADGGPFLKLALPGFVAISDSGHGGGKLFYGTNDGSGGGGGPPGGGPPPPFGQQVLPTVSRLEYWREIFN